MLPRVGAPSVAAAYAPIIGTANNDGVSMNSSRRRTATTAIAIATATGNGANGSSNNGNGNGAASLSSGRNQFGFAALPRLVFLPETPDEPLIRIPPRRRRRRKVVPQLPFSPPSYMNQQSHTKKKRSKKKRDNNMPVIGPLAVGDEDKMVTSMINTARGDAEVTLAAAKRALDISGQHRVAQLRMRCECAAHLVWHYKLVFCLPYLSTWYMCNNRQQQNQYCDC